MPKKVVVGLSGGVDSSVAAWLLKKAGYDVTAVFMINWHDKTGVLKADCPWDEDVMFAEMVAKKLDIPFHVVDLSKAYSQRVVDYMFYRIRKRSHTQSRCFMQSGNQVRRILSGTGAVSS
jgi:tRNA-specific 2-thiouridylase